MPAELEPPELARLIEFAERPRANGWSLRAALTRYAQPQPQRVGDLIELVRRIEFAIRPHLKSADGPAVWQALQSTDGSRSADPMVELLRTVLELDRVGDVLAEWAADPSRERPDAAVDDAIASVTDRLLQLGVPREQPERRTRRRG